MPVSDRDPPEALIACLRLARSARIGPVTYRALLQRFGSAPEALAALPELARRGGALQAPVLCSEAEARAELAAARRLGARPLMLGEADYPAALAAIDDAPPLLYARGDAGLLARPGLAVVGARNASANGCRFAERLAAGLGEAGHVVVSGLARGIDGAAHRAALSTGTIAVVAGGVDVVFPREHADLHRAIAEHGLVVSEMPPGLVPRGRHFPRRNRIISGLSAGVVVIEAARRSGTLITARRALDQGREVFAVPGSPLDPRSEGSNALIRDGAQLVAGPEDVLAGLGSPALPLSETPREADFPFPATPYAETAAPAEESDIVALLGPAPCDIDDLIRRSRLTASEVLTILLELELAGRLTRHPGNRVALAADSGG